MKQTEFYFDEQAIATLRSYQDPSLPDLVEAMKKMFNEQAQVFVQSSQAALEARNALDMKKVAHKFKSSCHHLGAKSLAELCYRVEELTRSEGGDWDWVQVSATLDECRRHLSLTLQHLGLKA